MPEVFLHKLGQRDHGVRTTNLDEFDDTGWGCVELDLTTLEGVVGRAMPPRNRSGGHNVSNVDVIALKESHVLSSTGLAQHDVVLNRSTGLILNLVLVQKSAHSVIILERGCKFGELEPPEILEGHGNQISNLIGL